MMKTAATALGVVIAASTCLAGAARAQANPITAINITLPANPDANIKAGQPGTTAADAHPAAGAIVQNPGDQPVPVADGPKPAVATRAKGAPDAGSQAKGFRIEGHIGNSQK